jgi:ATP-dependent Clp protease ATP-binding subunit ClpA
MAGGLPDATRQLLELASRIAFKTGSSAVEPVHLLFALAANGDNIVARIFRRHGLKPAAEGAEASQERQPLPYAPAVSERTTAVIDTARQTAIRRGEIPVRANHIALALMRSRDRWLSDVLETNGLDAGAIIRELLRELGGFSIAQELFGGDYNFAVWSEEAKRIVRAAPFEASIFAHDYIGSEHILLSLLRDARNPAAQFLEAFYKIPITIAGVPSAVKEVTGIGGRTMNNRIELTPNANRIITDCQLAASRMGRNFVGSEHILAAAIANPDCTAARALARRGNLERLRADRLKTLATQQ